MLECIYSSEDWHLTTFSLIFQKQTEHSVNARFAFLSFFFFFGTKLVNHIHIFYVS